MIQGDKKTKLSKKKTLDLATKKVLVVLELFW